MKTNAKTSAPISSPSASAGTLTLVPFETDPAVLAELKAQLKEEIGDAELPEAELRMLQQKYGIIAPKFTAVEMNIIRQGERRQSRPNLKDTITMLSVAATFAL